MLYSLLLILLLITTNAWAEAGDMGFFQRSDGMAGTWMDLGGGMSSYQDGQGRSGLGIDLGNGLQSYQFGNTFGQSQTFGNSGISTYNDSQGNVGSFYNFGGVGGYQFGGQGGTYFQYGKPNNRLFPR